MAELRKDFEYIICDSPGGHRERRPPGHVLRRRSDRRDQPRGFLGTRLRPHARPAGKQVARAEKGEEPIKEHLLLTRYNPERVTKGEMLGVDDVEEILAIRLLGVIPESQAVLKASNQGVPVILDEQSDAGQAYSDAVDRLLGKEIPHRFLDVQKKGFLQRLFGGRE